MTSPHDPEHTSPSSADEETTEVPLVDVVPPDDGQPVDQEPLPPRRWSRGHTIAAAIVAVGALVAGGAAVAVHYSDSTSTAATTQPQAGPNRAQQQPLPGQGGAPGSLGQLDVGQLDGLLNQLSNGKLDSDQLRALLALFGLPDHLDAGQLQDLLQQLGGGHLLDGASADGSTGVET